MSRPAKRQCQSKNKAGEPCRAAPITGDDHCIAHTRNPLEKTRFGGAQPGAGRPRAPKISEMMREALAARVEERVDLMLRVPFEAMEAEKSIVAPNGKIIAVVPDHPVRLKGWNDTWDRVGPKPPKTTEISGRDGQPINIAHLVLHLDEIQQQLREQERQTGAS